MDTMDQLCEALQEGYENVNMSNQLLEGDDKCFLAFTVFVDTRAPPCLFWGVSSTPF